MLRVVIIVLAALLSAVSYAADLRIATFNTESDEDTAPLKVAETIKQIGTFDILAVQEVESAAALKIYTEATATALGGRWRFVISESGFNTNRAADYLGIIYRTDLFRQLGTTEIHAIRSRPDGSKYGDPDWSLRGALVLRLQELGTKSEFQVATIHLKCCGFPQVRAHQAALLAQEIGSNGLPTILLGDSNIPIEPGQNGPDAQNQPAFDSLSAGMNLVWVKPAIPTKTQCDPAYNSMLDQVFGPAGVATGATAEIKFTEASYCNLDGQGYSDHRPVVANFPGFFGVPMLADEMRSDAPAADAEDEEFLLQRSGRPDDFIGR